MTRIVFRAARLLLITVALGGCMRPTGTPGDSTADREVDLVLRNGLVVNGTGAPAFQADVAVDQGRILAVGPDLRLDAREVVDATGLVVAPGFVDVHTHADDVAEHPGAQNYGRMGVTTVVAGNCGSSALPVDEALARIEQGGISLNYATLVGHNTVRATVMGGEDRPPTAAELSRMRELVAEAMRGGAVGLSSGLQYVPGAYAEAAEIKELARAAASADPRCVYASHMRNEGTAIEAAIAETVAVGAAAGCRVQISHLKLDSQSRWGEAEAVLSLLDEATARGIDVEADQYAYTAGSSGIGIRFPSWVLEGTAEQVHARLDDPEQWARIRTEMKDLLAERGFEDLSWATVANCRADPTLNGKPIDAIAREREGSDDLDAQLEVARELLRAGGASMVYHFMSEADVERFLVDPRVAVASDGGLVEPGVGVPHPRAYGNNARVLGHYVRERGVLSLEEAVRKMTSLPAEHFGFEGRGRIEVGFHADLVLFDPATVGSPATFAEPHAYANGIPHVLVNGQFVVRDGEHTDQRPGRVLRGRGFPR